MRAPNGSQSVLKPGAGTASGPGALIGSVLAELRRHGLPVPRDRLIVPVDKGALATGGSSRSPQTAQGTYSHCDAGRIHYEQHDEGPQDANCRGRPFPFPFPFPL